MSFRDGVVPTQAQIDPMYQYSLQYYQALFNLCLKNSEPCEDQAKRLEIIIKYSTENCYANICRGLFEKDKTLYSALLVFNILRHADKIPSSEWGLFVRGPGIVDRDAQPTNPRPEKIPEASWDLLCADLCGNQVYGAFVVILRVNLHAIDATPARWRGDVGSSPLDGASTAEHPTHCLISTQVPRSSTSKMRPGRRSFRAPTPASHSQ